MAEPLVSIKSFTPFFIIANMAHKYDSPDMWILDLRNPNNCITFVTEELL